MRFIKFEKIIKKSIKNINYNYLKSINIFFMKKIYINRIY